MRAGRSRFRVSAFRFDAIKLPGHARGPFKRTALLRLLRRRRAMGVENGDHTSERRCARHLYRTAGSEQSDHVTDLCHEQRICGLHESCSCGANPNAGHTRDTVDCDIPKCLAIDRIDQCVASGGAVSSVAVINVSTWASQLSCGRPAAAHRATCRSAARRTGCATAVPS
jgi:hypothetical protein